MSEYPIDEELARSVSTLPRVDRTDVAEARRIMSSRVAASGRYDSIDEGVTTEDRSCTGADGQSVELRVYRPDHRTNMGAIYHVHGGGFILGDLEMSHLRNVEIAREVGSVVVSVNYRLAPEWPFPTPLEDVYSGLVWLHERAGELEIDPSLVVLHGVSAGGGLAASTALLARDRNGPPICFQFLASPVLDDRLLTASSRRFTDTPALNRQDVETCWSAYLGRVGRGTGAVSPYAAPARAADLTRLPRTYISVAEFDPLRDEAIEYARSLLSAGTSAELHLFPGTYHGSFAAREAAVSQRQLSEEVAVLRSVVG
ncbi:acetyl esterase/lipase [Thermocatellispora tengchongensis]|uniref:Acetyl esterase/lipase n=1 Tax=Thermocatellispora tengchongensis TaxID=1073253 RepID=A0A840P9D8_9ACTN|nr:alpha/beta hydrolase [Thermocatellispora tengchongensis]MBB5135619.1 acetyl esterase/lipase [Thermocatellispora tengchongensis]